MSDGLVQLGNQKKAMLAYESNEKLTWCSGCGDFGIRSALIRALALEGLTKHDTALFYDIGCHGSEADKIGAYAFHGLHGRVIPIAAGAALGNQHMKVVASGGDGGTLSEGPNHLMHAVRSNYNMVFILHNNENYGLTTGQPSATSRQGKKMNSAPDGSPLEPMNVAELVMSLKPTFVARSFSGDLKHMTETIQAGLKHDGFAFIEIMQMCPTYNKATSSEWYWERIKYVKDMKHDPTDLEAARKIALDLENQITLGVMYQNKDSVPFHKKLASRKDKTTALVEEVEHHDISKFLEELR